MKYPLVRVTWLDAHGSAVQTYSIEEIPHAAIRVVSYGVLLKEDDAGVSIASEVCDSDTFRGYSFFPHPLVVSVEMVLKPRKRSLRKPIISPPSPQAEGEKG